MNSSLCKSRQRGVTLTDYLLILAIVAIASIAIAGLFGTELRTKLSAGVNALLGYATPDAGGDAIEATPVTMGSFASEGYAGTGGGGSVGAGPNTGGSGAGGPGGAGGGNPALAIHQTVTGTVPALKQPADHQNSCWATAAAMLVSWKEGTVLAVGDVVAKAGSHYVDVYNAKNGVSWNEQQAFLEKLGLTAEAPQNYTVSGWADLLKNHGPLYVTTSLGNGAHAWVITGISGDGTPGGTYFTIHNTWSNSATTQSVASFQANFENLVRPKPGSSTSALYPQVFHY